MVFYNANVNPSIQVNKNYKQILTNNNDSTFHLATR